MEQFIIAKWQLFQFCPHNLYEFLVNVTLFTNRYLPAYSQEGGFEQAMFGGYCCQWPKYPHDVVL